MREKSAKTIQKVAREYLTKTKVTATTTADSMILFKDALDNIPEKEKLEDQNYPDVFNLFIYINKIIYINKK